MRREALTVLAGLALAACAGSDRAVAQSGETPAGAMWAVNPAAPGPDLPPAGRSLFDFVASVERDGKRVYDIPFPFVALVKRVASRAGCKAADPCSRAVLIPLGRSLQRTAASPEFFRYPRVVVAFDGEPEHGAFPLLKDRLYLGYQERSNVVEVISWNEAGGRFEFQVVRDYRAGGASRVAYARRALCAACHQNLAPIFSRQVWEETNANPRVAEALETARAHALGEGAKRGDARRSIYGVPVHRGVDVPDAIDAATDRANLYAVHQRLWQEGCGDARCRAALLGAALQLRLTGDRAFDERAASWRDAFLPAFTAAWRAQWPGGLAIPNPDIPNRDPFATEGARTAQGVALSHVAARFEPLAPRPPLEVWTIEQPETARRVAAGLAAHVADADARALDAHLAARAARQRPAARRYEAPCELARAGSTLRFKCVPDDPAMPRAIRVAGRVDLAGAKIAGGEVGSLVADGAVPLEHLEVVGGTLDEVSGRIALHLASRGMHARLADGARITGVALRWKAEDVARRGTALEVSARATVTAVDEFAPVRAALAVLAEEPDGVLGAKPFGRARVLAPLFARLGVPVREWCCEDAAAFPAAEPESEEPPIPAAGPAKDLEPFYPLCASCHATGDRFPPNFLAGSGDRVAAAVRHCAPRIYARLAMWRVLPDAREKTPMPPASPLPRARDYPPPAAVAGLERMAAAMVRSETGTEPQLAHLLEDGYERLRPCLPEGK
jgi:hypothetical protein